MLFWPDLGVFFFSLSLLLGPRASLTRDLQLYVEVQDPGSSLLKDGEIIPSYQGMFVVVY
jgi:hypothetical protein